MADSSNTQPEQQSYNVYADPNSPLPIVVQASSVEEAQKKAKAQVASNKKSDAPATQEPLTTVNMPPVEAADGVNEVVGNTDNAPQKGNS